VCGSKQIRQISQTVHRYQPNNHSDSVRRENWLVHWVLEKDKVDVGYWFCSGCQHLFANPTFSDAEITRIYQSKTYADYLENGLDLDVAKYYQDYAEHTLHQESRQYRPAYIFRQVSRYLTKFNKVIDLGGGDGANLSTFITDNNSLCYIQDICAKPLAHETIIRLPDASAATAHKPFDLAISTHALEHIPEVNRFIAQYAPLVEAFYIEVPSQFWLRFLKLRKPALSEHVNFFSPLSLTALFAQHGFANVFWQVAYLPYQTLRMPVIVAIFQRASEPRRLSRYTFARFFAAESTVLARILAAQKLFKRHPALPPLP
jgi:hypothetical protein